MCVCAIADTLLPGGLETYGQRMYCLYWHTSRRFQICVILMIFFVLKFVRVWRNLQISLLCIMEEFAGGGSVAVAVGVSDR